MDYAFARPRIFDYVFSQYREGARQFPDGFRDRQSPTLNPIADAMAQAMQSGELGSRTIFGNLRSNYGHWHTVM